MKKFTAILLCLLTIVTLSLAGCAGFSIDPVKYYNEVVAKVGDTNITRFELVNAYNSYGSRYYSGASSMDSTLDLLINREILYQYALQHKDIYKPNAYQMNELFKNMFESIDEQMDEYVEQAKKIFNIKTETEADESSEEDSNETRYPIEDYYTYYKGTLGEGGFKEIDTRRAKLEIKNITYYTTELKNEVSESETPYFDVEYTLSYSYVAPSELDDIEEFVLGSEYNDYLTDYENVDIKTLVDIYFEKYAEKLQKTEKENTTLLIDKAKSLLAESLINYEFYLRDANNKPYNKKTPDLIKRYFERNFKDQIKSQYLTNIRTVYLSDPQNLDLNKLTDTYKYLVDIDHNQYYDDGFKNHIKNYQSAIKDIGTKGDTILYHPSTGDVKYGYFVHTLLNFSDTQTTIDERDPLTGEVVNSDATLNSVLEEYRKIYEKSLTATSEDEKQAVLDEFIWFMFKYTGDAQSTCVPGMPYVVGYDYSLDTDTATDDEINAYSSMVVEFTKEAGNLMKDGISGKMTDPDGELCKTEYGIHLLYFVGDVSSFDIAYGEKDDVYIGLKNISGKERDNLYYKVLNPLTNQTYFDMLFDKVYPASSDTETYSSNNGYSEFEDNLIKNSKLEIPVVKYTTKIQATKPTL